MSLPASGDPAARPVDAALLQLLACPACPSRPALRLSDAGDFVVCTACARRYPILPNGIPVLLVEEALPPAVGA